QFRENRRTIRAVGHTGLPTTDLEEGCGEGDRQGLGGHPHRRGRRRLSRALHAYGPARTPPATLATLVRAQVQLLRALLAIIAELEAAITTRVAGHPRAKLLASLPGVSTISLAQLLTEVGPILDRVD